MFSLTIGIIQVRILSRQQNKQQQQMKHIGLFEGIGGFSLAARWMGWETIAWCEWNEFGQKVLKHHFPKATPHGDITKTDFTIYNGQCDILTGGFPCQPYSSAGKRLGKEDERHLWPQMLRAIREIEPTFIVGENVRGLLNWNGGMVFDEVCADLENIGYEVTPCLIPAVGVNAPHKRERIWFVAYSERLRLPQCKQQGQPRCRERLFEGICNERDAPNTNSRRLEGSTTSGWNGNYVEREDGNNAQANQRTTTDTQRIGHTRRTQTSGNDNAERIGRMDEDGGRNGYEIRSEIERCSGNTCNADAKNTNGIGQKRGMYPDKSQNAIRKQFSESNARHNEWGTWQNFPTQSPICSRNDGLSSRLDGITFSKWRNESIKAGGNAIVPQVAYQIFKAIELCNSENIK